MYTFYNKEILYNIDVRFKLKQSLINKDKGPDSCLSLRGVQGLGSIQN